jgi:hypothetical protein
MKTAPRIILSLFLLIGLTLPINAHAKGKRGKKIELQQIGNQSTITDVTATTITVTEQKPNAADTGTGNNKKDRNNQDNQQTRQPAGPITYQITELSDITVNGESATVNALKVGMVVSISADPPDGLGPVDKSNGGVAREIVAHDAE